MESARSTTSATAAPSPGGPSEQALALRLAEVGLRDAQRLQRRLDGARRTRDLLARRAAIDGVVAALEDAETAVARRRATVPLVTYPPELPVSQRRDDIAAAIRDSQVVVVAGETGSGKTTQLPKICLELGRGVRGMIGHTQPRRIAARSVAERVAEELGSEVGETVGYAVRFTDQVGPDSLVKLMTDGILLAEVQRDRDLLAYDTIIIDEAHERSLTIDFLLGYLVRLLPRRPDLKVIITSATIDPQRFADHFTLGAAPSGGGTAQRVPVVEVSGRTYPVEVRYRPLVEEAELSDPDDPDSDPVGEDTVRDQTEAVLEAVEELSAEGDGDVLVFLSGEREIRDTAEALLRSPLCSGPRAPEVLPLYGRLSAAEQHRVFATSSRRRVVLSTNVAETSLTVPGIRYVVDTGTARISRYSLRTKVQRLPIEPISQASANQRAGRCGRVAEGICIRLYSEADFEARPRFTEPEVQRTNLASVILTMTSLGLGEVEDFPFLDPPDRRQVRDGVALLHELGALDPTQADPRARLTDVGRRIAGIPVDPRLARMVLEADRLGVLAEVLVVVAALSVQDVRERPREQPAAGAAVEAHRRFAAEHSDFLSVLNLWSYLGRQADERSSSSFRRMCRAEFLHYLRIREWQDLHSQLRRIARGLGMSVPPSSEGVRDGEALVAVSDAVHQSVLAGLLAHVGLKDVQSEARRGPTEFAGARGTRFAVAPGSVLAKKPPAWLVAGELVETSRLWARTVARIDPLWVESLAGHLVKRSYSEPRWERRRAAVVATERVTLYGLPLVTGRAVGYGRIDAELSRELFIRRALVEGDWTSHHAFLAANRALLDDVEELAARARRRDLLVDDETLFGFYDARIPPDVVSGRHFDAWWKRERRGRPDLLTLDLTSAVNPDAEAVAVEEYPLTWTDGRITLNLTYRFTPGEPDDGVTVHVPLALLNQVSSAGLDWQVPGLRTELVTALLRSLPKPLRVQLVPVPDTARDLAAALPATADPGRSLASALSDLLRERRGVLVPTTAWDPSRVPDHLRPTYVLEDERGRVVAGGKDLDALRERSAPRQRSALAAEVTRAAPELERERLDGWPGEELPDRVDRVGSGGQPVVGYPALVVEGEDGAKGTGATVALRVLATQAEQAAATPAGLRRLVAMNLPAPGKAVLAVLGTPGRLALARSPHGSVEALLADCAAAAVDDLVTRAVVAPVRTRAQFDDLVAAVRPELVSTTAEVLSLVQRVLSSAREVERALDRPVTLPLLPSLTDARAQLADLVRPGFVAHTTKARLPDVQRYLRALLRRLEVLSTEPVRDRDRLGVIQRLTADLDTMVSALPPARRTGHDVAAVRWMLQELRVSFFAQVIGTPAPVSEKRVTAAIRALRAS